MESPILGLTISSEWQGAGSDHQRIVCGGGQIGEYGHVEAILNTGGAKTIVSRDMAHAI